MVGAAVRERKKKGERYRLFEKWVVGQNLRKGGAARGRAKEKEKNGSKGSTMDWSSSHMEVSSTLVLTPYSMGI